MHNALGQRVQKSSNTEHFNYLYNEAGQLIATLNDQGDVIEEYLWLGGMLIAAYVQQKPVHYTITHRPTDKKVYSCDTTNGTHVSAVTVSRTDECAQWIKVKNGDYFHIQRATANHFLKPDTNSDGSQIAIQPNTWAGSWTQWNFIPTDTGYGHIKNRATGKFMFLGGSGNQLLQQPSTWGGHYTQWQFKEAECIGCNTAAQAQSQWVYVHNNHLATPQTLTDANQQIVWKVASQTPFGIVGINHDADGDDYLVEFNLRFPGQYYDKETGLNYNYFRDYDPSIGRYIQSDPIGLDGGINTYAYVEGNPLSYIDPYGLAVYRCSQPAFGWAPVSHQWLRTDSQESGMGPVNGSGGNAGNESGDWPGDPVETVDHGPGNRDLDGAQCQKVHGVDEDIVNEMIEPGQRIGNWWPNNQCQSFVSDVLRAADTRSEWQRRRDARRGGRFGPLFPHPFAP